MSVGEGRDDTDRWGDVSGFGALRSEHGPSRGAVVAVVRLVGAVLVVLVGLVWAYVQDVGVWSLLLLLVVFGGVVVAPSAYYVLRARLFRRVGVFEGGVVVVDGAQRRALPWAAIAGVSSKVSRRSRTKVDQTHQVWPTGDGDAVVLTDGTDLIEDVMEAINGQVQPRVFREAAARVNRGGRWDFGTVAVDAQGVHLPTTSGPVPWAELEQADAAHGFLMLFARPDRRYDVPSAAIRNLPALLLFLDDVIVPSRRH